MASTVETTYQRVIEGFSKTKYKLHHHQETGLRWLLEKELEGEKLGGLLCDDPGLGKTIQMAALINSDDSSAANNTTLIVVPTSVVRQWTEVMEYILGKEFVYVHTGGKRTKGPEIFANCAKTKVCITTYGILTSDSLQEVGDTEIIGHFAAFPWRRLILDEGHQIRNRRTKVHRACMAVNSKFRWILSGTPVQNSENDLASMLEFIRTSNPDMDYCVRTFILRRTKDILYDKGLLDRFQIVNHSCEFVSEYEQALYKAIQDQTMADYNQIDDSVGDTSMADIELIMRLRQAAIHPNMVLHSLHRNHPESGFNKLHMPADQTPTKIGRIVNELQRTSGLSLVFCHFRYEMDFLNKRLRESGIRGEIYNGSLSAVQRENVLKKFSGDKYRQVKIKGSMRRVKCPSKTPTVLIIQIKAGGVGLNLQQFNNVFIVSPDWNPANEIQAISRAHRIGQDKKVNVHKFTLICNPSHKESITGKECDEEDGDSAHEFTTIDERILKKQICKRTLMEDILIDKTFRFNESFTSYTDKVTTIRDELSEKEPADGPESRNGY